MRVPAATRSWCASWLLHGAPNAGVRLGQVIYRGYCVTSVRSRLFRQGKRLGIELRRAKLKPKTDAHGSVPHLCVVHVRERVCMCAYVCVCVCVCACIVLSLFVCPTQVDPTEVKPWSRWRREGD